MNLFDVIEFITNILTSAMGLVGAAFALAGLIAMGLGVADGINHFKPENRDNPGEKSRLVSGIVKFALGALLATGGYQVVANNTFKNGGVTSMVIETTDVYAMTSQQGMEQIASAHGFELKGA